MNWFQEAKEILEKDGVILCPTDTIWGLSGNALHPKVIEKLYCIKQRPKQKSFIILMHSIDQLHHYVDDDLIEIESFLSKQERPTTVIYQEPKNLPQEVLAHDGSIGIRIANGWMNEFLHLLDFPILSSSANISGEPTPITIEEIDSKIKKAVDYIAPRSDLSNESQSSQIVRFIAGQVEWLRK